MFGLKLLEFIRWTWLPTIVYCYCYFYHNYYYYYYYCNCYYCDYCYWSYLVLFRSLNNLRTHKVNKHSSPDSTCAICSLQFPFGKQLKEHMKSDHRAHCFPCDICDYLATRQDSLMKHKTKAHG